ncbi:hypothetical protein [Cohnella silvisoli]|uniref:Uncharacterized protein n=1 Tax=Cohnella silvisoli TaxID=2873699 RepID=A0ABV1KY44_9BACL|nr:hypothetical protein [Cohnella silvisoli]MCD9021831.1 hypothetical protein [Cohnella silvisoli]
MAVLKRVSGTTNSGEEYEVVVIRPAFIRPVKVITRDEFVKKYGVRRTLLQRLGFKS